MKKEKYYKPPTIESIEISLADCLLVEGSEDLRGQFNQMWYTDDEGEWNL